MKFSIMIIWIRWTLDRLDDTEIRRELWKKNQFKKRRTNCYCSFDSLFVIQNDHLAAKVQIFHPKVETTIVFHQKYATCFFAATWWIGSEWLNLKTFCSSPSQHLCCFLCCLYLFIVFSFILKSSINSWSNFMEKCPKLTSLFCFLDECTICIWSNDKNCFHLYEICEYVIIFIRYLRFNQT